MPERFDTTGRPDSPEVWVFVDDQPDEVPRRARVIGVSPYIGENPHDRGLAAALGIAQVDAAAAR